MQFSVYQETHIGGRKVNQDRMGYSFTRDALLLVLADGMGGHMHGEIAAQVTLQTLSAMFQQEAKPYVKKPERFLQDGFMAAHVAIQRYRVDHKLSETPRTTVVACLIQHNTAVWAHCGDSRLYWMRRGQVLARTRDHSQVESLIARGLIRPDERDTHPDRNKLFNCLGASSLPRVEVSGRASMLPGDVVLLCSDGLWGVLPDAEMAHSLYTQTIVRAVPELVENAVTAAGKGGDNVTALAILWQGSLVNEGVNSQTLSTSGMMSTEISTEALPDNLIGTTIQGFSAPAEVAEVTEADAFDDDEIERAIAEIRGAIDKSSSVLK
jgi:protein phosphatase